MKKMQHTLWDNTVYVENITPLNTTCGRRAHRTLASRANSSHVSRTPGLQLHHNSGTSKVMGGTFAGAQIGRAMSHLYESTAWQSQSATSVGATRHEHTCMERVTGVTRRKTSGGQPKRHPVMHGPAEPPSYTDIQLQLSEKGDCTLAAKAKNMFAHMRPTNKPY